jgi:excisionase family DNA binding protein
MQDQLAFSLSSVCKLADIGRTALYEEIAAGKLRAVKRGRRTLILADDLRRWLDALPAVQPNSVGGAQCRTSASDEALRQSGDAS